jgi:cytochrome c oxidase cbb3-type subunit III
MRSLLIAAFVLSPLVLLSQDSRPDPAQVERGRTVFKSNCGFCHGEDATGNRAPDLVRADSVSHDLNGDVLAPLIRSGRPSEGMPAFATLTAPQIADIVVFLHFQVGLALASNHVPADYPLAKLLTGNAAAGKAFFNGAGGCATCHSPTGDLAGIGKKYAPVELQSRFLHPRRAQATVTVRTRAGEQFEGALQHVDEFELAMTDKAGWHHSWPRNEVQYTVHDPLARHRELLGKYTDADMHNMFAYLETLQ